MERSLRDSSDRQLTYHTRYKTSYSSSVTRWSCQWSCCTAQTLLNILPSLPKFLCAELCVCKQGVISSETRHQIYQTTHCNTCNNVVLSVMQLYWSICKHCFIFFYRHSPIFSFLILVCKQGVMRSEIRHQILYSTIYNIWTGAFAVRRPCQWCWLTDQLAPVNRHSPIFSADFTVCK